MSQVVRIPQNLYVRLEKHARGFDSPANVIERILNYYERQQGSESEPEPAQQTTTPLSLEMIYYPDGELNFKRALLDNKKAYVLLHKIDGTSELKEWDASKFTAHSDVNGNLRSGYLRSWKSKGIYKAEIAINKNDLE